MQTSPTPQEASQVSSKQSQGQFEEESKEQTSSESVLGKRTAFDLEDHFAAHDELFARVEALTPNEAASLTDWQEIRAYKCLLLKRVHTGLADDHLNLGTQRRR